MEGGRSGCCSCSCCRHTPTLCLFSKEINRGEKKHVAMQQGGDLITSFVFKQCTPPVRSLRSLTHLCSELHYNQFYEIMILNA